MRPARPTSALRIVVSMPPDFQRIDSLRTVSEVRAALEALEVEQRREVILTGLRLSRYQWMWSSMALVFGVPETEWPEQQGEV